ncbi:acyl-CoA carboxylase epsilon subunit [Streptomyces californicus]|uniref:acyl-CoA carboxylase epsilon subunit n=1 Tax=Streptomyces californicus TaxID=67351 RepID=UPI0036F7B1E7
MTPTTTGAHTESAPNGTSGPHTEFGRNGTTEPTAGPGPAAVPGTAISARPAWRISGGSPTAEETAALAAVLAVVLGRAAGGGRDAADAPGSTGTGWHRPPRVRAPSPGTWRGR